MSDETLDYYGHTLKLRRNERTGRWHGSVQLHNDINGRQRFQDTTRERVL